MKSDIELYKLNAKSSLIDLNLKPNSSIYKKQLEQKKVNSVENQMQQGMKRSKAKVRTGIIKNEKRRA